MGCLKITYRQGVRQLGENHFFIGGHLEKGVTDEKKGTNLYPFGGHLAHWQKEDYRFGFMGQHSEEDQETGFSHFEARKLDGPRWTTPDPARQYPSPYVAFGNNPINRVDPDGRLSEYTMGDNGDISMTKFTLDNHDDLFAANGDLIAGGIRKGILADGMNFLNDVNFIGLNFDELSMDITHSGSAQSFVLQLSTYLEKEIGGFQVTNSVGDLGLYILPTGNNTNNRALSVRDFRYGYNGNETIRYSDGTWIHDKVGLDANTFRMHSWFHTHPGQGNEGGDAFRTGGTSGNDQDYTNHFRVPGHIYGGIKGNFNTQYPINQR